MWHVSRYSVATAQWAGTQQAPRLYQKSTRFGCWKFANLNTWTTDSGNNTVSQTARVPPQHGNKTDWDVYENKTMQMQTNKKTMLENQTFDFQSQSLSLRSVTTEKLWTENVKRRRFIHSELQSSAGGHQGQNQLEHSSGLIVTSLLQVSLLTLKQTIYTYIFIYIRVYRIHPDSGYKIVTLKKKNKRDVTLAFLRTILFCITRSMASKHTSEGQQVI